MTEEVCSNGYEGLDASRGSLAGNTSSLQSSYASAPPGLISWHGHSFQPMTFRILNAICEVCHRSCSDLRSPPPALECVRCRMRIHRTHVEQHEKFVVCPKTVKQWLIRAPSSVARKEWISKIKQLQQAFYESQRDGFTAPMPTPGIGRFGGPLSSSTRYQSMRHFPNPFSNASLRDTPGKKSVAETVALSRRASHGQSTTPQVNTLTPPDSHNL